MYRFKSVLFSTATSPIPKRFSHPIALFGSLWGSVGQKVLPPELSKNVVKLTCKSKAKTGACDVYLVGTIHRYPKSVQDVRALVKFLKPQVVFLELCSSRATLATTVFRPGEFQVTRGKLGGLTYEVSKYKVESEFQAAFEEAQRCGARVILGDRPMGISERRIKDKFARAPFSQIIKMGLSRTCNLLPLMRRLNLDDLYNMSPTLAEEESLRKLQCPIFIEIEVYERDQYMSHTLLNVAREHSSVVAVVGKAHLLGIQKYWEQPIKVEQLRSFPPEMGKFNYGVKSVVFYISCGVAISVYAASATLLISLVICLVILLVQ